MGEQKERHLVVTIILIEMGNRNSLAVDSVPWDMV